MNTVKGKEDNFYTSKAWRALRKFKIEEYGGFCQRCIIKFGRIVSTNIEAHHIKPRSKFSKLELEPDNIVILCKNCNLELGNSGTVDWDRSKEVKKNVEGYTLF
jgi:5-methylcytosine-specific restriction endonuclease McrA